MKRSVAFFAVCLLPAFVGATDFVPILQIPNETDGFLRAEFFQDLDGDALPDLIVAHRLSGIGLIAYNTFGEVIYVMSSPTGDSSFGKAIEKVADRTGDGVSELLVTQGFFEDSMVFLVNPVTQDVLVTIENDFCQGICGGSFDNLGFRMAEGGDVNADGVSDFLFSNNSSGGTHNAVSVHDGVDGTLIHFIANPMELGQPGCCFGFGLAPVGDINGDGYDDFAISDGAAGESFAGAVKVYSGLNAEILWESFGETPFAGLGGEIRAIPDQNGDGISDLVVGQSGFDVNGENVGRIVLLSGGDGSEFLSFAGSPLGGEHGVFGLEGFRYVADMFGDGADFLMVVGIGLPNSIVNLFSFATREVEFSFDAGSSDDGYLVGGAVDFTLDGVKDALVVRTAKGRGGVTVYMPVPGPFLRGDSNADGNLSLIDALSILEFLFTNGAALNCRSAADTNADASLALGDPLLILTHLFLDGAAPAAPFPDCGAIPSSVSCEEAACP